MSEENVVDITGRLEERRLSEGKERHYELANDCIKDFYEFYTHTFKPYGHQDIKHELMMITPTARKQERYHSIPEDAVSSYVHPDDLTTHVNLSKSVINRRKRFLASYVSSQVSQQEAEKISVAWISADAAATVAKETISIKAVNEYSSPERAVAWFAELGIILDREESVADKLPTEEQALLYAGRSIFEMRVHSSFTFHYLDQFFKKYDGVSISSSDIVDGLRKKCTPQTEPSFEELGYATPFSLEDLKNIHRM